MVHPSFLSPAFIDATTKRLSADKNTKLGDITAYLDVYKDKMNSSNFVNFLNIVGKRKLLRPYHIFIVASGLQTHVESPNGLPLNEIDQITDSLKFYPATVGSVRILLAVLTEALQKSEEPLCSRRVGNYLHALRNMRSGHLEVRDYINVLTNKISHMNGGLVTEDLADGLQGMQLLSSAYPEVLDLVSAVTKSSAEASSEDFSPGQFGRCMLGFQRLDLEEPVVQTLLTHVLDKVNLSTYKITTQEEMEHICNVVTTLASGDVSHDRLANVLKVLISTYQGDLPSEHHARAIEALRAYVSKVDTNASAMHNLLAQLESLP